MLKVLTSVLAKFAVRKNYVLADLQFLVIPPHETSLIAATLSHFWDRLGKTDDQLTKIFFKSGSQKNFDRITRHQSPPTSEIEE